MHAQSLREVVNSHLEDPLEFALAWDEVTEARLTPWYRETITEDRGRLSEIEALREGSEPPRPSDPSQALRGALLTAMLHDADLFRAFLESRSCLTPLSETFAQDGVPERIGQTGDGLGGLGNDRAAVLESPAQHHLRRALAVSSGDVADDRVLKCAAVTAVAVEGDTPDR